MCPLSSPWMCVCLREISELSQPANKQQSAVIWDMLPHSLTDFYLCFEDLLVGHCGSNVSSFFSLGVCVCVCERDKWSESACQQAAVCCHLKHVTTQFETPLARFWDLTAGSIFAPMCPLSSPWMCVCERDKWSESACQQAAVCCHLKHVTTQFETPLARFWDLTAGSMFAPMCPLSSPS